MELNCHSHWGAKQVHCGVEVTNACRSFYHLHGRSQEACGQAKLAASANSVCVCIIEIKLAGHQYTYRHDERGILHTTGEQAPDGWTIITQRFFATARVMMQFPGAAMRSIQPDILHPDSDGNFHLPSMLPEPERRHLPTPALSQTTRLQRINLLQQVMDGKLDVADLTSTRSISADKSSRVMVI